MDLGEILAEQLEGTREWTQKLLADLSGDDWGYQPGPGLAHPLWICGHLAFAEHGLIHVRCMDDPQLNDDFIAHFKMGQDVAPLDEHAYPSTAEVVATMDKLHTATLAAVQTMTATELAESAGAPHPHFSDKLGAISHCCRHEAFHAGQLALIRRLLGKPPLR